MKKVNYLLLLFTLALVMTAGIGRAWAYFTTYASAQGGILIELGSETEIKEEFSSWKKRVVITNDAGSEPVYIRVKAFSGSSYKLEYSGTDWSLGEDGYYYYSKIVPGDKELSLEDRSTSTLTIEIKDYPTEELEDGMTFNVVVIYESTPVMYKEDGTPYANWDVILDNGTTSPDTTQKEGSEG